MFLWNFLMFYGAFSCSVGFSLVLLSHVLLRCEEKVIRELIFLKSSGDSPSPWRPLHIAAPTFQGCYNKSKVCEVHGTW